MNTDEIVKKYFEDNIEYLENEDFKMCFEKFNAIMRWNSSPQGILVGSRIWSIMRQLFDTQMMLEHCFDIPKGFFSKENDDVVIPQNVFRVGVGAISAKSIRSITIEPRKSYLEMAGVSVFSESIDTINLNGQTTISGECFVSDMVGIAKFNVNSHVIFTGGDYPESFKRINKGVQFNIRRKSAIKIDGKDYSLSHQIEKKLNSYGFNNINFV